MVPGARVAEPPDVDRDGQTPGDDAEPRLPIAEPDLAGEAAIGSEPPAAPRQPIRRIVPEQLDPNATATESPDGSDASEPEAEPLHEACASADPDLPDAEATSPRSVRRGVVALVGGCAALILGAAVYLGIATSSGSAVELGEMVVSSHPAGARVLLDGVEQGTTPLVLRLAPGRHRVEIAGADGAVQPIDTEVAAGQSVSHHVELFPALATSGDAVLVVDTGDPVAQLFIDGRPAGATPLASTRVAAGRHTVRVRYLGNVTIERQVIVPAGETVSLVLDPPRRRPSSPTGAGLGLGSVRVNAPFHLDVLERDRVIASSAADRIDLEPGLAHAGAGQPGPRLPHHRHHAGDGRSGR